MSYQTCQSQVHFCTNPPWPGSKVSREATIIIIWKKNMVPSCSKTFHAKMLCTKLLSIIAWWNSLFKYFPENNSRKWTVENLWLMKREHSRKVFQEKIPFDLFQFPLKIYLLFQKNRVGPKCWYFLRAIESLQLIICNFESLFGLMTNAPGEWSDNGVMSTVSVLTSSWRQSRRPKSSVIPVTRSSETCAWPTTRRGATPSSTWWWPTLMVTRSPGM